MLATKNLLTKLLGGISSFVLLILGTAGLFTVFTAVTHAHTCAKLTGFPGFLQRVGFVSAGPCVSRPGGTICSGGTACTTSDSKAGTCKNIAAVGQAANCSCVANTVSKSPIR
jgi:hypothetical protein